MIDCIQITTVLANMENHDLNQTLTNYDFTGFKTAVMKCLWLLNIRPTLIPRYQNAVRADIRGCG